jgi:hypothetical protein
MQGHEVRNCLVHVEGNVTPFTVVTVNDVDAAYLVPSRECGQFANFQFDIGTTCSRTLSWTRLECQAQGRCFC